MIMKTKTPPPYQTKILKRAKVNNVKIYLKAFRENPVYLEQDQTPRVFYYIVSGSDGGSCKLADYEKAVARFEAYIEFEKRQLTITKQ